MSSSAKQFGINRQIVIEISEKKSEPGWMTDFRLKALEMFQSMALPSWGPDLSAFDLHDLCYYMQPPVMQKKSWDDIPDSIKKTMNALGLPQAEQELLAGLGVQYESEMLYKQLRESWSSSGVIFTDTDSALKEYPELFKRYFATLVGPGDNPFAALNAAVWSGGSFVYVPKDIQLDRPLQAYFRIEEEQLGQFERTLIIAESGASLHYVEGCSAPVYRTSSLHAGVVEVFANEQSSVRYSTIQNWSNQLYNLVTKRARAEKDASVEWLDGNIGSAVTMKYPSVLLHGTGARGSLMSVAIAGSGQVQDTGGKMIHLASNTTSQMVSKSISKEGGVAMFRGLIAVPQGVQQVNARSQCDALILDDISRADAFPDLIVKDSSATVGHEASIRALDEQQEWYMMSRGLTSGRARSLMVTGFVADFVTSIPLEYAVEINRLIELEMEGGL